MRIFISDYCGHAFPADLSRALARRGHQVLHVSAASFQSPKGRLGRNESDPDGYRNETVTTRVLFDKDSFVKRRQQEIEIGRAIAGKLAEFEPEVVISGNVPLETQRQIQRGAIRARAPFIYWVQDLHGEAITRILRQKLGLLGALIGHYYTRIEARLLRQSDHCIVIAQDFVPIVRRLTGMPADWVTVIENWSPLSEIDLFERDNPWACAHLPASPFRMIYSGTLGFKHNPGLLLSLAGQVSGDVIVFSEGGAADMLKEAAAREGLKNLHVRGWLPFDQVPMAQAGADVLIAILEPDAGIYSVPSKILTYMCVGRPVLGAMPTNNLASKTILQAGAGMIVNPTDAAGFVTRAQQLASNPALRHQLGMAGRAYAEHAFDVEKISARFEAICAKAMRGQASRDS